jgi:micrococcal nuclease
VTNWNWLAATGLVLTLTACGATGTGSPNAAPDTSSAAPSSAPPSTSNEQRFYATVVKVTDGDTIHVSVPSGAEETVRIVGIDTPETKDPRKPVQCGGPEATAFASTTLLGRNVRLVPDPTQAATDRYGRTLAYVELVDRNEITGAAADSDYSTLVTEAGLARAYIYDRAHPPQRIAQVQAAEMRAHNAHRGIWGAPCAATQ